MAIVAAAQAQTYDVVIANARIVDGTGAPWYYGDVAVTGKKIAKITPRGMLAQVAAKSRIDGGGKLVLAPGFIDIQGHSRPYLLSGDGRVIGKVSQGVTTEILGEGSTNAPANPKRTPPAGERMFSGPHSFNAWLEAMKQHGASINFGSFIGSGTLRQYAKGMAEGRLSEADKKEIAAVVREAMEDGAFGIASALIYPPDSYQSTEELISAAKAMAPYGGVYITHMRSEGDQLLEAMDEAIRIGREAGVAVEIYHLKAAGQSNWAKESAMIERIEKARAAGMDVQANMYPYTAGSTGLSACFPPWASADGKLFDNLASTTVRARIKKEMLSAQTDWENLCAASTPEGVLVLGLMKEENRAAYAGKRLNEIATAMKKDWTEAAMDLVLSERQRVGTVFFMMSEENVKRQLQLPWIKIGTDAGGPDPERASSLVHPRSYGTYARILGKYVREEKTVGLEDAVRKMTSAVAVRLGIQDRGVVREGAYADLVLFDPATVEERATYAQPHQVSVGIEHVLVNGVEVWTKGKHTGAKPGEIVRGPGWSGGQ